MRCCGSLGMFDRELRAMTDKYMNPEHPGWKRFLEELKGPIGIQQHNDEDGFFFCPHEGYGPEVGHLLTRKVLRFLGYDKEFIERSVDFFMAYSVRCSCKIWTHLETRTPEVWKAKKASYEEFFKKEGFETPEAYMRHLREHEWNVLEEYLKLRRRGETSHSAG